MSALIILVAAIIVYSTEWLYYRSVFVKRIKAIESEKDELKSQIVKLKRLYINMLRQISNFNDEDYTEIFEISPGRTDNDKWIDQSGVLAKKQLYHVMS